MRSLWPHGGLWRHRDFLKLWSAETVSQFGSQISGIAIPLVAILTLDSSAFEVALLSSVEMLPFLLIAFAPVGNGAIPFLLASVLVGGFSIVAYNIIQVSYRQAICPPRLQGRMNSVMRFLVWGTIPIGALVGGALGTWVGLRETIVIGGIGGSLSILWIVFSPQRHLREMPEPVEEAPPPAETPAAVPGVVDPWADDPWGPADETRP